MVIKIATCLVAMFFGAKGYAQEAPFKTLTQQRTQTNETGMKVLGAWGAANIIEGLAGYSAAKTEQWRSFHSMNAIWGVINLGIAGAGYVGAKKELRKAYNCSDAVARYEATRRLFLLNAGLDGVYIASGFYLTEHAKNEAHHPDVWRGYGKSFILQGSGLLVFDVVMYAAHGSRSKAWYKALQGVCISGNGVGLRCSL